MEKMTNHVADKAVEQMQRPIDKAKDVQAVQNVQTQDMKNMVDQPQSGEKPEN
ncbi:hypothetical protein VU07_04820 [Desulfobulbus sp. F4]|nr:hypothetical protein [Desulfobulbus sp. F4]